MKIPSLKNLTKNKLGEKRKIFYWTLFDFANTSFSIVVVTFLYAVYFKETVAKGEPIGDLYWSIGTSTSMLITAFISPVLGAIADYSAGRKRFLLFFTLLCIIPTSLLFFIEAGDILAGLILFILASIGFEAGLVFYDAFLPDITAPKNYGRVSGYGYGMGYIGSLVILIICFPFIEQNMIKETFPIAAIFFLLFSIPFFLFIKDNRKAVKKSDFNSASIGFKRVAATIKNLPQYKNLALFLLAFFFYIEGVNTVIFFSGNYASTTLKFTNNELIIFFIIVQSTAILGSILFGVIADSFGQKRTILLSLYIWIFTMIVAFITSDQSNEMMKELAAEFDTTVFQLAKNSFYIVGLLAGSVMGATQSVSRSLMSKLTPESKKTEFFGFYSFFGKSSAIVGPLVFGYISFATESQRIAILSLTAFFIIGILLLKFVEDDNNIHDDNQQQV